jgi:hypothetical protein
MYKYETNISYKHSEDDDIYRKQLCIAFDINDYEHEIIMNTIKFIHDIYENNEDFQRIIEFSSKQFNESEGIYAFMYLFSWDYFEHTHKCLKNLHENNCIDSDNINFINLH